MTVVALRMAGDDLLAPGDEGRTFGARSGSLHRARGWRSDMTDMAGSDSLGIPLARPRGDPRPIGGSLMSAIPALAFLGALFVVPLGFLLSFAFLTIERGDIVSGLPTLQHFYDTLTDDLFWIIAWRSFWVGVVSTVLCLFFAYPVAWVYAELKGIWRPIILVLVVAPLLTSAVVRTYAWIVILGGTLRADQ